jgi:diadenosine tetraphosphate (Ap4A) HIT family hydrolase
MDDSRFAWLVLVPRISGACELIDLDDDCQRLLLAEINQAGRMLLASGRCDKLNIGALGNIVRQMHVHVIARMQDDAAWPGPVWGSGSMQRLSADAREQKLQHLREHLQLGFWGGASLHAHA